MIHLIWLFSLLILCLVFICYIKRKHSYWLRYGFPFVEPHFLFGNLESAGKEDRLSQILSSVYQKYKDKCPMIGLYFYLNPVLVILDLNLIRHILITDFQYFQERGFFYNEIADPLSANLFRIEYDKWKSLRAKFSPTFSPGKMKIMFSTIIAVADEFIDCLGNAIQTDCEIEAFEWMGRFTADVIGKCAFGIECNNLRDPHTMSRYMCKKHVSTPRSSRLEQLFMKFLGSASKMFGLRVFHKDVTDFFVNFVKEIVKYREKNQVKRNDFMNLLLELKNSENNTKKLTIDEIAAEAMLFFIAGYSPPSSALIFSLYELAMDSNKHIQNQARHEIRTVLEKYDGKLSYEALNEMTYVGQIINEVLRKHQPNAGSLVRMATKNYKVPNTNFIIPKGTTILIPTYSIHHDPNIYEDPETFKPNRFSPEQIRTRPSCSFLTFGDGPRNCIAMQFGSMQTKIGLVKLLMNFEFSTCARTEIPIKYSSTSSVLQPKDGTWLKINKIM